MDNRPIPELSILKEETFLKVHKTLDERSSMYMQRKLGPKIITEAEKGKSRSGDQRNGNAIRLSRPKGLTLCLAENSIAACMITR